MSLADDVASLENIDPDLVRSELRPHVERIMARVRHCGSCGERHIQKRNRKGPAYCRPNHRVAAWRRNAKLP